MRLNEADLEFIKSGGKMYIGWLGDMVHLKTVRNGITTESLVPADQMTKLPLVKVENLRLGKTYSVLLKGENDRRAGFCGLYQGGQCWFYLCGSDTIYGADEFDGIFGPLDLS